ncbi:xanthine dehydrogenase family protein molybdopterin-binding subunit [Rhodoligotrophos defluvii]|uniref:xanthine dehydrogenase family protein molybdopterin-binding subunit n=1 Tax=Rhodoligotrophos defluvii TaxID=2561934 RepID=UPI001485423D|nr:xanthine dehydrogenase family protein molybdopterin-binding subunit [Rhodoligotrophos defluvii]
MNERISVVGQRVRQADILEKVMGRAVFTADLAFPRMLTAQVVRSPIAHGKIRHIDVSRAERVKGVRAIVRGSDAPYRYNLPLRDQPFLAIDRVRYVGEPVVGIAAEDEDAAREAASLIHVDYEPLPAVFDPEQARAPGAPLIHPEFESYWRDSKLFTSVPNSNVLSHFKLRKGDCEAGFAQAEAIFEGTYKSQAFNHGALEPHACIAQVERHGQLTLWSTQQSPWFAADDLAIALGWPVHRVRVIAPYLGGGFGAKHGLKAEPPLVAIALKTDGRPVKLVLTREEVFSAAGVRGAVTVKIRTGVKRDGTIVAREAEVVWDTGAYADVGPLLCRNGSYSVTGPYRIPNQKIDGYCVYTNKVVTSAFRSYGIMEMSFAYESHMDEIARGLGIDPVEIRRRNLIEDGDETATGERLKAIGLKPTLDACAAAMGWDEPKPPGRGRAIVTTAKSSVAPSGSSAFIQMNDDGTLNVMCATTDMGQGARTVMSQLAAEAVGARYEDVHLIASDTAVTPPDRSTSSSRSTFNMGNAVIRAGTDAKKQVLEKAAELLDAPIEELEVRDSTVRVRNSNRFCTFKEIAGVRPGSPYGPIVGRGSYVPEGTTPFDLETGQGRRITGFWLYSSQGVELSVDTDTGKVTLHNIVSAHDTGRTLNPAACEGQVDGGVAIGCSAALMEELVLDESGRVANAAFGDDYPTITSADLPPITPVFVEIPHPDGPYGAKGIGEGPTTGIAAAVANAVEDAIGVRIRDLPITPEKILRALGKLPAEDRP